MSRQEREVRVGGVPLQWFEEGDGEGAPFLLVHGWGSSSIKWFDAMPLLAKLRRTISLDLPGFGRSATPHGPYTPQWLAGSVRAFMDAIGLERAVLVGNSLGGLISIHVAAAWPERVEALVALDAALPNDGPRPPAKVLAAMLGPTVPVLGEVLYARYLRRPAEVVVRESLERNCADPSRVSETMLAMLEAEARDRAHRADQIMSVARSNRKMMWALSGGREATWRIVRSLKVPTLYLWGDSDKLVPLHVGERAVRETPGAHLVVIDDCGHNPQMEKPEEFAAATIAFARAVEAAARA